MVRLKPWAPQVVRLWGGETTHPKVGKKEKEKPKAAPAAWQKKEEPQRKKNGPQGQKKAIPASGKRRGFRTKKGSSPKNQPSGGAKKKKSGSKMVIEREASSREANQKTRPGGKKEHSPIKFQLQGWETVPNRKDGRGSRQSGHESNKKKPVQRTSKVQRPRGQAATKATKKIKRRTTNAHKNV